VSAAQRGDIVGTFRIGRLLLGNVSGRPSTRRYPEVAREYQERTRGHVGIDKDSCIMCGICSKKCPTGSITVDKAGRTWTIMRMSCVQCGYCVESCPKKCLSMENDYIQPSPEKVVDRVEIPERPEPDGSP
jgi:ech hydrogenase subunit F